MSELILHHYPASPFAEKARLLLGFKGLEWQSVMIPTIMPKPDLTALTGGYRRTPVLQMGADIYCDTALIARLLDTLEPAPALVPDEHALAINALVHWAETVVFPAAVALVFEPQNLASRFQGLPEAVAGAFAADRKALFTGGSGGRMPTQQAKALWPQLMQQLDEQLQAQGDYLFGTLSLADFALAHPLWFLLQDALTAPLVEDYPAASAWLKRVLATGHGTPSKLKSEQAIEIAKQSTPRALPLYDQLAFEDLALGQQVSVSAIDYGVEPSVGALVYAGVHEVIIAREDARAGLLHVHFPRLGFAVKAL